MYEVAEYIEDTLRSIAGQTHRDFEAVLVDDGSTDGSAEIAHRFAEADGRFRVVSQANGGLGRARNAGLAASDSDLVWFVDGDDMLTPDALRLLTQSLDRTGSDFATGMGHRFCGDRRWPAPFLKKAFLRSRPRTHVTRFAWLVSDRVAWNKLWRRSFLDEHVLRFKEDAYHEDIPMVLPAHYLATAVDVISRPVYLYRQREGEKLSITQRRIELPVLLDRLAAVEDVCDFLEDEGFPERPYHEALMAEDLRYHLDVLDQADAEYQAVFLTRVNALLERLGPGVENSLPAIQRLKWQLVRRGRLPELLDVLAFERDGGHTRSRVRIAGRTFGAYPYLDDPAVGIPRSVYRIDTTRRRLRHTATLVRPATVPRRVVRPALPRPAPVPATQGLQGQLTT